MHTVKTSEDLRIDIHLMGLITIITSITIERQPTFEKLTEFVLYGAPI